MKQFRLVDNALGWLAFFIAAFVYCSTIEPTASFWDCPEFITTGYKLEIGHPPGAPFFMLTANLFSQFTSDPTQVHLTLHMDVMGFGRDIGRTAVAAQNAGSTAIAVDFGVHEVHIVALAVQHTEETGIVGMSAGEVGQRVAVTVKVNLELVGGFPVQGLPVGQLGHVDVGLQAEIDGLFL